METVAKARDTDMRNARTAQEVQDEWAQYKEKDRQVAQHTAAAQKQHELGLAYKVGAQHAVDSLLNTPRDVPGYQMPGAGATNTQMYQRPQPQPVQTNGLADYLKGIFK